MVWRIRTGLLLLRQISSEILDIMSNNRIKYLGLCILQRPRYFIGLKNDCYQLTWSD